MQPIFSTTRALAAITLGVFAVCSPAAGQAANACDLNADGAVNALDYELAVAMSVGRAACSARILASGACNVVMVQRVSNAVNGSGCMTDANGAHSVTLTWVASPTPNVTYSVYRGTVSGGPYSLIKSNVTLLNFLDASVLRGATYYYVVQAVDGAGNVSVFSDQAVASVPST